jgi:putative ABC transport system permease protein
VGFIQAYKMALKSILSNKMRAFLTMLGVIIGVGAVIAAVSFALGSTKSITDQIQGMGTNLISVSIRGRGSNINLSYADLQKFADDNSQDIAAVAPTVTTDVTVKAGTKTRTTSMVGTVADYETIKNTHVQSGRFILQIDSDLRQKVAVIGTAVVNDIFSGSNPINQIMKINGEVYKVVGVLQQTENGQTSSNDDQIIIPVTSAQRLTKSAIIRNFSLEASDPKVVDAVVAKLNKLLTQIYKNTNFFTVRNQAQILSTLGNITGILMGVLGGIATISLVVGGIGIMNIMLVSVTERTREIGIRKAIGAKKRSILIQFLIEALMVTGIGGIIGVLFGLGIIKFVIGGLKIVPTVYSVPWMLLSFGISLGVGVIFGMFPAYKASNLNPIEALRFE